jgi:hypothetical protein
VVGGDPALGADPDPLQVRGHVDEVADHGRVDGIVVGVDAHVVVPAEPDPVPPAQVQRDRWQRQHRCSVRVQPGDRRHACRADDPRVRTDQPVGELGVEVRRRGEGSPGHERGLEPCVTALDDPLGLRVLRRQQHQPGRQSAHERRDAIGSARPTPDARLVVPQQPTRNPTQLLDQLPRPQQQVLGLAGRQHPGSDEPRVRGGDHQHRQLARPVLQRNPLRWEPQITLRRITRLPNQAIRRIDRPMLRAQPLHILPEPADRALPADSLSQHRRRHLRRVPQQSPHPRLEHGERRRSRHPLIPRRRVRVHRLHDRCPRDPQPLGDPRLRHALRSQPPDQRQSSKVITLQSSSVHFSPPKLFSSRAPPTFFPLAVESIGPRRALLLRAGHAHELRPGQQLISQQERREGDR